MGLLIRRHLAASLLAWGLTASTACLPNLDDAASLIAQPKILAIAVTPPEAAPGQEVELRALVATPTHVSGQPNLHWTLCEARRPLSELGPVSTACFGQLGPEVRDLGQGPQTKAVLSEEGCRLFGPQPPLAKAGEPLGRPVDPDVSGGYYQPAVVHADDPAMDAAVVQVRLACGIAGVVPATSVAFRQRYQLNRAPALVAVQAGVGQADAPWQAGAPLTVSVGATLNVLAQWPACAQTPVCGDGLCTLDEHPQSCAGDCAGDRPVGCEGAEAYVRLDPVKRELEVLRESVRVAWYASAGEFGLPDNGRNADEVENFVDNVWVAPTQPGLVKFWLVVRDDRGATSWVEREVIVQ